MLTQPLTEGNVVNNLQTPKNNGDLFFLLKTPLFLDNASYMTFVCSCQYFISLVVKKTLEKFLSKGKFMSKKYYLKFDTAVRDHFKSTNAAILFNRMLYWFERKPEGFWKFKQPCTRHKAYKKGDSWGEELLMTRKMLDPLMERLCTRYQAKMDFLSQDDKFKGKMFASYLNRKTNQTHYVMNSVAIKDFLTSLNLPIPKFLQPLISSPIIYIIRSEDVGSPSAALPPVDNLASLAKNLPSDPLRDVPNDLPLACARLNTINTQTTTTLSEGVQSSGVLVLDIGEEEVKLSKMMVDEYNSQTASSVVWLPSHVKRLVKTLKIYFGGKIEAWRQFLREKVCSSKFLMGEAHNSKFKAILWWVIKPDVLYAIFHGGYGVGTRIVNNICNIVNKVSGENKMSEESKIEIEIKSVDRDILNIDLEIKKSRQEIINEQKNTVSEHEQLLSEDEKNKLLDCLKAYIDKKYAHFTKEGKNIIFRTESYHYIRKSLCENLGFKPSIYSHIPEDLEYIAVPQELLDRKASLMDTKADLVKKRAIFIQEKKNNRDIIENALDESLEDLCFAG